MAAAIDRMVRTRSVALVRVHSQWWAAENDCPVSWVRPRSGEALNALPHGLQLRSLFDKPVFWTRSVQGLVDRGKLRFVGRKVKAQTPPYNPTHARAEFRHS